MSLIQVFDSPSQSASFDKEEKLLILKSKKMIRNITVQDLKQDSLVYKELLCKYEPTKVLCDFTKNNSVLDGVNEEYASWVELEIVPIEKRYVKKSAAVYSEELFYEHDMDKIDYANDSTSRIFYTTSDALKYLLL